jgi:hypothetical protein
MSKNQLMKNTIWLLFIFFYADFTMAQAPTGISLIDSGSLEKSNSFMLRDQTGTLWIGYGGFKNSVNLRSNMGLKIFKDGHVKTIYPTGIFTDAIEKDGRVMITAINGLYTFKQDTISINSKIKNGTCIKEYKGNEWIGTMGQGLFHYRDNGYHQVFIKLNGISHDSIYSLCPDGNVLWVGTSRGLLKFENNIFTKVEVPVVKTGFADAMQRIIHHMEIDGYGRLWILNHYGNDTIPCIYMLIKDKFVAINSHYAENCGIKHFPKLAHSLGRTAYGHILIPDWWGIIECSEKIENIPVNSSIINNGLSLNTLRGNFNSWAKVYEDKEGYLYISTIKGLFRIDRRLYTPEAFKQSVNYPGISASGVIDINDIRANVSNDGTMFNSWDIIEMLDGQPAFKSKTLGCAKPMYTAALWMGGKNKGTGDLHVAAQTYRQKGTDFRPGPARKNSISNDSLLSEQYNRIWKINRKEIEEFISQRNRPGYVIPQSVLQWPANPVPGCDSLMAPYVDIDKNGIYEPLKGDYPKIKGDQMLWWVFNDLAPHGETKGRPMRVQVNASCYAYNDVRLQPDDDNYLVNRTLFFEYQVINTGSHHFSDFTMGIMNDVDLGYYGDDYFGCDSSEHAGFGFNVDNDDEGPDGLGKNPPMILCKFLNQKMRHFMLFDNSTYPFRGNPNKDEDYYYYMRNLFYSNTSHFPSQGYPCGRNIKTPTGDFRSVMSCWQDAFAPGDHFTLDFAYILVDDPDMDWLKQGCNTPRNSLQQVQQWYDNNSFPSKPDWGTGMNTSENVQTFLVYPNPANTTLHIVLPEKAGEVIIHMIDLTGKDIPIKQDEQTDGELSLDISRLSSGIYLISMQTGGKILQQTFMKY